MRSFPRLSDRSFLVIIVMLGLPLLLLGDREALANPTADAAAAETYFGKCSELTQAQDWRELRTQLAKAPPAARARFSYFYYSAVYLYEQGWLEAGDFDRDRFTLWFRAESKSPGSLNAYLEALASARADGEKKPVAAGEPGKTDGTVSGNSSISRPLPAGTIGTSTIRPMNVPGNARLRKGDLLRRTP
jgi:hypothetical protein